MGTIFCKNSESLPSSNIVWHYFRFCKAIFSYDNKLILALIREMLAAGGVDAQQDEQQEREAPQGGAAVAEEGEGYAYDGAETDDHPDVD